MDLLVCPTTVLDGSSHNRIWRRNVQRPAPARESDDRADLSHAESEFRRSFPNHLGLHCSIYFLDSGPPLLWRVRQGAILDGARPNCGSTEPAGIGGRRKMGEVPRGGSARDPGPEFLYSVLGRCSSPCPFCYPNSQRLGIRRKLTVCLPGLPAFIGRLRRSRKPQDMKLLPTRSSLSMRSWASRMS